MSTGRNSPCPCGSGKRFKQCCGSLSATPVTEEIQPLKPEDIDTLLRQGWAHQGEGRTQQAQNIYQRILKTYPDNADAMNLMGNLALQLGQFEQAIQTLEKLVAAHPGIAVYHSNLGNAYRGAGLADEAKRCYRKAIECNPDYSKAYNNLGVCLKEAGQMEEAAVNFSRAIELEDGLADAWANLANTLVELRQYDEAEPVLRKALALNPRLPNAHLCLGKMYARRHEDELASSQYRKCLELAPDLAEAHWALAMYYLADGDLQKGWREYTWRTRIPPGITRPFPARKWQGESFSGKRVLTWGEQGIGDEILFASCLPDLLQANANVLIECEPRLCSLFARSFPTAKVFGRSNPPNPELMREPVDFHLPLGNLPAAFRLNMDTFATGGSGYLKPDPERVTHWCAWLASLGPGPRIGISWRSMKRGLERDDFYTDLTQWGKILALSGMQFVNLQYDNCESELAEAERKFGVNIHRPPNLNLKDDLDDVAALIRALDLVIAPNTSVFGMAGAVGAKTWLLNLEHDWTMLGTDRMPWFPSVEVFAKSVDMPWETTLEQVAARLADEAGTSA